MGGSSAGGGWNGWRLAVRQPSLVLQRPGALHDRPPDPGLLQPLLHVAHGSEATGRSLAWGRPPAAAAVRQQQVTGEGRVADHVDVEEALDQEDELVDGARLRGPGQPARVGGGREGCREGGV